MVYAPQVEDALRYIDQNNKTAAQRILAKHLQANPFDEDAWLWLAYILPTRYQQLQALAECLKYFPGSSRAQHNQDMLRLGIPMDPPNLFPDIPPEAESYDSRKFPPTPASDGSASSRTYRKTGTLSDEEPEPYVPRFPVQEQPVEEAPPRYTPPQPEQPTGLEWLREEALATPPALPPVAPLRASHPVRKAPPVKTTRKKSRGLNPAQTGCITILVLLLLAIIIGGIFFIFSRPPMSNLIPCFEAVLSNEYPCAACPPAAQSCPECPTPTPTTPPTLPPPAVTATSIPAEPTQPAAIPTTAPEAAAPSLLPAPLYFISEDGGSAQIWRVAQDGSFSALTSEVAPITAFDVSPANGQLAYISNNSLYLTDTDGGNRTALVNGSELPGIDDPAYWSVLISAPVWSPDGTRLAFAQDGIQVLQMFDGEPQRLVTNVYVPEKPNQALTYAPLSWSPDGARLAVSITRDACTTLGLLSTQDGGLQPAGDVPVGSVVWFNEENSLLVGSPASHCACQRGPGLYRVDSLSGASQVLQGGMVTQSAPAAFVGWPKLMTDGSLLYFYGELTGPTCVTGWPRSTPLSMTVGVGERWDFRMQLRTDSYLVGEALWAADGSLAIIRDQTQAAEGRYGPLLILYADGRPSVALSVNGRSLHWGVPVP